MMSRWNVINMNPALIKKAIIGFWAMLTLTLGYAGTPLWTFAPVAEYPAKLSIGPTGQATVQYIVTNQSNKPHLLRMAPIAGIAPSGCVARLEPHQSCTLSLSVTGSALAGDLRGHCH